MKKRLSGLLAASLFTLGSMSLSAHAVGGVTDTGWGTSSTGTANLEATISKLVDVNLTGGDLTDVIAPDVGGNPTSEGPLTFTGQILSNYTGNVNVQLSGNINDAGDVTLSGVGDPVNRKVTYNFAASTIGLDAIGGPDFVTTALPVAISPGSPVALDFHGTLDGASVDFTIDLADTYTGQIIITATAI